jgi:hypothetical protein
MSLTKTLKFEQDVLDTLKEMEWTEDGLSAKLTGQLSRDLYVRTNKALEAMGGKWNRKAGAHLFSVDPRLEVEGLIESGSLEIEKDGFFETPEAVIDEMVKHVPLIVGTYLEPSAGTGAIVKYLTKHDIPADQIIAVEKNIQRCDILYQLGCWVKPGDFLQLEENTKFDRIYMNPPFEEGQDIDHVLKAYKLLKPGGKLVSVMSAAVFYNSRSKYEEFRKWVRENENHYLVALPDKSFHASGTDVGTVLFITER